jgi:hypothetical protein
MSGGMVLVSITGSIPPLTLTLSPRRGEGTSKASVFKI